jgi:putative membrane protein
MWDMGMGGFFWMPFVWLAFAGLVAWLVFVLVRPADRRSEDRATTILEERFARGEIDRDEFLARKADLAK